MGENKNLPTLIPDERIVSRIFLIRGRKVMFDNDLAELYEVKTRELNQAVRRNLERFPNDFMFQLTTGEFIILKSQFVTSSWGGIRKKPLVFTEQGVAMLSSVLRSRRAIQVNIQIIRTFTKLRQLMASHEELRRKIEDLERKSDQRFKTIFELIKNLLDEKIKPKTKIGFRAS
ncbi:MAG: DNA-binding protein [Candidatus Taylorbacteria bacterium RIFCSPHIGHO2_02_FULL_44_36]|uniref:DNA-binding protein n=1 Tax=Candidatus Taylorbacteria bacterium RIFCSPLOWO2_12_FULL_44_15c TaxID=1802333 RepID=A0A1G2P5H9_9BACT|nr:MAG: DNA-binding protein [Candidatus Taylorbacteria bacterium RIFCSPHIGHO2_02_FULL_44_36]OHA38207.1 MAG: DNA-binding protein [Candidatus Taylorbacteria bacterium RIFCSPLOWO2_02_FULL_44_35]OHA43627.1 MAG: DNA-binding protein [Candidatus Taylorbacteria bacterium RIFCSPLOWO2_12_FULL_44_15c]